MSQKEKQQATNIPNPSLHLNRKHTILNIQQLGLPRITNLTDRIVFRIWPTDRIVFRISATTRQPWLSGQGPELNKWRGAVSSPTAATFELVTGGEPVQFVSHCPCALEQVNSSKLLHRGMDAAKWLPGVANSISLRLLYTKRITLSLSLSHSDSQIL